MPETFCDKLKFKKSQNNFDSESFKKNLLLFSLWGLLLKCFIYFEKYQKYNGACKCFVKNSNNNNIYNTVFTRV